MNALDRDRLISPQVIAVDNGATRTRLTLLDRETNDPISYSTPHDYEQAIGQLGHCVNQLMGDQIPDCVGFSVAGKVESGVIVQAGKLQEYGWVGQPFAQDVADEIGLTVDRVVLLNDCAAGATSEREERDLDPDEVGAFMVLSTGFGAALYRGDEIIPDEPGHYYLKPGAVCGDGQDGHIEAHIAGSGIEKKYGTKGENILSYDPRWNNVKADFHAAMHLTLDRYFVDHNISLRVIGFAGSVALGGPRMLQDLQVSLTSRFGSDAPAIVRAFHGELSGLYGAGFAALQALM